MFKIKRPAIIGLLVVLLVFTGYINHQLTQQALLKSSNDYQKHEELEMVKNNLSKDEGFVETLSEGEDDIEIIDSVNNDNVEESLSEDNNNVEEVINGTNEMINETISKENSLKAKNYFIEYRLSRDKLRAGLVDRLNNIVNNNNTNDEMRTEAQKEIIKIGNISEKELQVEGLIKAKGFDDVLVFLTDKDVKVVVSSENLSEQDVVKILDIVKSETSIDANDIKIMKKN
ncbi:SpoIIIAH-like family protein [Tissierella sp. MSJ-40]|uniref:SpoIIIAH-like family protein n=1 Tax=Tissierella simiarum TaxID=2841534 RepID=A0ABS6E3R9_9FIRM|nr:SpoIIIAH-like family protein [Tissierella simiarum]MBU5437549.1 SpoIIIAH-like family protein [Tissierella simiarum]